MFYLVNNINCIHQGDVFLLGSVTYVTFYTKLQIMPLKIAYKNEPCSQSIGRKNKYTIFSQRHVLGP